MAWENTIRSAVLDKANNQLSSKDAGAAISKAVLKDLKRLDKLAKKGAKEEVPEASLSLRAHVLEFVALEPQRLQDRYGVGDL